MLRFNSFRAARYLRSKFVEGRFLLASEASDLELEIIDLLRKTVKTSLGDIAVDDAWKVTRLSATQILIVPGEAWFKGLPFQLRSSKDQLVSGASLAAGILPSFVTITDEPGGTGKIITFNNLGSTPTALYRVVVSATEAIITDVDDQFLHNANLSESTAQKIRLIFRINIVPEASQTETPTPYTNDSSVGKNLVNQIVITPTVAGNGELITLSLVSGSEIIDGRDAELTIRNDPGIGGGNPIPNGTSDQSTFSNGTLIDSLGASYHINAIFNDTVSTQVIIRIDKEVNQPNPQIINTKPYTLIKRDVFVTDDVNGVPQGKLFWPLATVDFDTASGVAHDSKIDDLRGRILDVKDYQNLTNIKPNLRVTDGGTISFGVTGTDLVTWGSSFKLVNPGGLDQTIAAGTQALYEGGSLVYNMQVETGGAIERGTFAVTSTSTGTSITLSGSPSLATARVGNILRVDGTGDITVITAIDDTTDTLTVSPTLPSMGAATIYLDSFGPATAPLNETSYTLAVRKNSLAYVAQDLVLGVGESNDLTEESAVNKLYEDRNILLTQGGTIAFSGTSVTFTEPLHLEVNSRLSGGSPVVIDLTATTRTVSLTGRMIYAVIDRIAGTAVVTDDAAVLPAVNGTNREVFLIAKRVDTPGAIQRLYFREGTVLDAGQQTKLGAASTDPGYARIFMNF